MPDNHRHLAADSGDQLRQSAETLIKTGATPRTRGGTLGLDALSLLYKRAGTPESAADTLKLLYELQTHQVELDLLHEQLRANEQETVEEIAHYKALYECAPAAYLIVANDGRIIEGNRAAQQLFRASADALFGKALWLFLALGQQHTIHQLLVNPDFVSGPELAIRTALVETPDHRTLEIRATRSASRDSVLMILTEVNDHLNWP